MGVMAVLDVDVAVVDEGSAAAGARAGPESFRGASPFAQATAANAAVASDMARAQRAARLR
jgi:hypothetical protein